MKALASLMIIAGISIACTSTGTERKGSVPVGVSDTIAAKAPADKGKQAPAASMTSDRRAKGGTLNLAFVGDIMPGTTFPDSRLPEKDGATLFKDVDSILTAADVAAGNMEGALADEGETTKKGGKFSYSFRVPTRYGKLIADAGFDFMSMANNHAFDFGLDGVKSTEATLHSNGIAYSGIGGRKESAIVERNGIRYGFCAFGHNSYTLKHADQENVKRIIGNLREKADIVIVSKCPAELKPMEFRVITKAMNLFPYQKLYFTTLKYGSLRPIYGGEDRKLDTLTGDTSILLLTGIASPQQMIVDLKPYTERITPLTFPDHHQYTDADIDRINAEFEAMKGNDKMIVTTEKDNARLCGMEGLSDEVKKNIYVLPVEVGFMLDQEEDFNENIIGYVRKNSRNSILAKAKDDNKSDNSDNSGNRTRTISFRNN